VIYFWSFYIVVLFILLNMFISIIMEAAEEVKDSLRLHNQQVFTGSSLPVDGDSLEPYAHFIVAIKTSP
jgi:hypothetical protein